MTRCQAATRKLAFSAVLLAMPFTLPSAQDVIAVAERLKVEGHRKQGLELGWIDVTGDASSMVIEGREGEDEGRDGGYADWQR